MVMPLRADVKKPLLPESDEESWQKEDTDKKLDTDKPKEIDSDKAIGKDKGADKKVEFKPFAIEVDGIEARAIQVHVKQGTFGRVAVNDKDQLVYARTKGRTGDDDATAGTGIKLFDLAGKDKKEQSMVDGKAQFDLTDDGRVVGLF